MKQLITILGIFLSVLIVPNTSFSMEVISVSRYASHAKFHKKLFYKRKIKHFYNSKAKAPYLVPVHNKAIQDLPVTKSKLPYKSFYFIRHGSTDWNRNMLAQGPMDLPLNQMGTEQVRTQANTNANFSMIITSKLKRCYQTAEILASYIPNISIILEEGINERHFGDWSKCKAAVEKLIEEAPPGPSFFQSIQPKIELLLPDNAEKLEDFDQRIVSTISQLLNKYNKESLLFVGHGCVRLALEKNMEINSNTASYLEYGKILQYTVDKRKQKWDIIPIPSYKPI